MAEWFKAHAWKVCVLLKVPRVRIPVSPPLIWALKSLKTCISSLNLKFDVIYIDGYHYGPQVFKDCMNAWRFIEMMVF